MTPFTIGEIARIREGRELGIRFSEMCARFYNHTRDEMVEAYDAISRNPSNHDAQAHLHRVLTYQVAGVPLINGKPVTEVEGGRRPMF